MKRNFLLSLPFAAVLLLLSLFYKTGALEPMPYVDDNPGIVNGIVAFPSEEYPALLANRGLPLPIVSIDNDEDSPGNYYKSLIVGNMVIDYLIFFAACFGVLSLIRYIRHKKPA